MYKQNGFTITEILVTIGLLSILTFAVSKVIIDTKAAQEQIQDKNDFNRFMAVLNENIRVDKKCEGALNGIVLPAPGAGAAPVEISLPNYWNPTLPNGLPKLGIGLGEKVLISGPDTNPRIRLTSIKIQAKNAPPLQVSLKDTNNGNIIKTYNRYLSEIIVYAEETDGSKGYHALPPQSIDLPVYVDPITDRIEKCMVQIQEADVCQMVGSDFDPVTRQCIPKTQCQVKGVWQEAICNPPINGCPGSVPNNATGQFSCPAGSVRQPTGTFNAAPINISCGKKCSFWTTPTITMYICMACN